MLPGESPLGANAASRNGVPDVPFACKICAYPSSHSQSNAFGAVRGNTTRFSRQTFKLWKCPQCLSIHSLDPVDFADIYSDYPLNKRHLDVFARGTLHNLLRRLKENGLGKSSSILDYGCGNGVLIQFLNEQGYADVAGFDPYVERFASPKTGRQFDWVIANDVIEHVDDPQEMVRDCAALGRPGGMLYIGTADSEPVQMTDLEPHVMRLHQPFHRVMITQATLNRSGAEAGLEVIATYRRSYMDTLRPFSNYRFLDEFNRELGHDLDLALDPAAGKIVARRPKLLFYAFFGYFYPVAFEPAVVLRLPG